MNTAEVLSTLQSLGKPQTAAIYKRHGAGDNVFGALTSAIEKLRKKIKVDHALAAELWETGNAEARMLALQISDPQKLTRASAERLLETGQTHFLGAYLAGLLGRSPIAETTMRAWMASADANQREIGYDTLSVVLRDKPDAISDEDAVAILKTIESEIHNSPNWAKHAMNGAVITIGIRKPALRKKAMDAAKRIGKIVVDHGETNCETPDACRYIEQKTA